MFHTGKASALEYSYPQPAGGAGESHDAHVQNMSFD